MNKGTRRTLRTLAQLIVSGGFTALISALTGGLAPSTSVAILAGWQLVVTFVQNSLEEAGTIPTLFPAKPKEE